MSDKKISIGIVTTANTAGATAATAALDDVVDKATELDETLGQTGSTTTGGGGLPAIPAQAKKARDGIKEVQTESTRLGKGGDAGRAVLEFSRAFEDAQYGIRGILNNIPGLIAAIGGSAGLAGVISVAAVGASILWEKFGGGAKAAAKETEDLTDTFAKLLKVYQGFEDLGKEGREKAAEGVADKLKSKLGGIDNTFKVSLGANDVATAKATADAQIKLAKDKLDLSRTEAALVTATGEAAVRLAKQREAIIAQIYKDEQAIAEIIRTAALAKATAKVEDASGKVDATKEATGSLDATYQAQRSEIEALRAEAEAAQRTKLATVALYEQDIAAKQAQINDLARQSAESFGSQPGGEGAVAYDILISKVEGEIAAIKTKIDATYLDNEKVAALTTQADAKEPALAQAAKDLTAAATAEAQAAKDLTAATLELKNLRQTQGIQREGEAGLKQIADAGVADQKIEGEKTSVVGQLDSLVSGIGESGGKDLAPFITEMKAILQDKALSADELARVPVLLAQYFGRIANLGAGQNAAIRDAMSKVDSLEREVAALKISAVHKNP